MRLPNSYYNKISYLGTIIAAIAWVTIIFFVIQINFFTLDNVYFDLYAYLVTPGFLVLGLVMIPFGMYRERKRIKKGIQVSNEKLLTINLSDSKTRNAILIFTIVTIFFLVFTVVGSYKGFNYTESVGFCGKLCHKVMNPEYVAYQNSPHARVKCSECHVGEGADFYVKSKMSGLRQIYKYLLGTYVRPIVTPIENLRPARETCEKCHWPQKFYTNGLRKEKYFLADSANTEYDIVLDMKIGADHQAQGLKEGIHWHINPDIQIEYKSNKKRDTINWVKVTNKKTGITTVYSGDSKKEADKMESRGMDCMDCHNRPSHEYRSPSKYVNNLLASNTKMASIPWLKAAAMEALKVSYTTDDSASLGITNNINNFYKKKFPSLFAKYNKDIAFAITEIKKAYALNAFPEMKVDYSKYPRHIGHLESNGCFRCHNNTLKSNTGKVIPKDCNLCHSIIGEGKKDNVKYSDVKTSMEFAHPADIGDAWKEANCMDCHAELYK